MAIYAGIDLGTSNTIIALRDDYGVTPMEPFGYPNLPSCMIVEGNNIMVGHTAKNRRSQKAERYISNTKPHMPNGKKWTIDGVEYTPKDVAREILKAAVEAIRQETGSDEEIKAVITVPACYTSLACAATKEAAAEAGLTCLGLELEPVAAAIGYGQQPVNVRNVLIVDIGGGTFDLSIVQVSHNNSNPFSFDRNNGIEGDTNLGGNDFDRAILEQFLLPNLRGESSGNQLAVTRRNQQLEDMATNIKEYLQGIGITQCRKTDKFPDNTSIDVVVTMDNYMNACSHLLFRMSEKLEALKARANVPIDRVLLVGGMANDPLVRKLVAEVFPGITIDISDQFMNVIAAGAAEAAWYMENNDGIRIIAPVTYTAIGVAVDVPENPVEQMFSQIIPRGITISQEEEAPPYSQRYSNMHDNDTEIVIRILESTGSTKCSDCAIHGEYIVPIQPKPAHKNCIRVDMSLDINRELKVTCIDEDTNKQLLYEVVRLN